MSEKIIQLSKDTVLPISVGLLIALVAGVWTLAVRVKDWELRLESLENKVGSGWTYHMERESWKNLKRDNPTIIVPDIEAIREIFSID